MPGRARLVARALAALLVLGSAALATADPAAADPARPTDYRSRILSVRPTLPAGVDLAVVGGDSFLELRVRGDHTVVVPDYEGGEGTQARPYLRFLPDGTVERNRHAAATAANESRYGTSAAADIRDEPEWTVVARDGRYVWHDHRIHWMLPKAPTAVDESGRVDLGGTDGTWTVDLEVDGAPVTVRGELLLLDAPNPAPWFALVALGTGGAVGVVALAVRGRRPTPHRGLALALATAGALATVAGVVQWRSIPPGAGGNVLTAATPAIGLVAALTAAAVGAARVRLVALAVAVAALGGWAVLRREALVRAVLPTSLPFAVDRAATALALGLAVGVAVTLAWRPPVDPAA